MQNDDSYEKPSKTRKQKLKVDPTAKRDHPLHQPYKRMPSVEYISWASLTEDEDMGSDYDIYLGDDGWYVTMTDADVPYLMGPFQTEDQAEEAVVRYLQHL